MHSMLRRARLACAACAARTRAVQSRQHVLVVRQRHLEHRGREPHQLRVAQKQHLPCVHAAAASPARFTSRLTRAAQADPQPSCPAPEGQVLKLLQEVGGGRAPGRRAATAPTWQMCGRQRGLARLLSTRGSGCSTLPWLSVAGCMPASASSSRSERRATSSELMTGAPPDTNHLPTNRHTPHAPGVRGARPHVHAPGASGSTATSLAPQGNRKGRARRRT